MVQDWSISRWAEAVRNVGIHETKRRYVFFETGSMKIMFSFTQEEEERI
jgi:hypothetical protein